MSELHRDCMLAVDRRISNAQLERTLRKYQAERFSELWQAAKDFLKGGRHKGDCNFTHHKGPCTIHLETYFARRDRLKIALDLGTSDANAHRSPQHAGGNA